MTDPSSNQPAVRRLAPGDVEDVVRSVRRGINMSAKKIRRRLQRGTAFVFDDGAIRGCSVAHPAEDTDYGVAVDAWVYAEPGARRQGIGRLLWEAVWPSIRESGAGTIFTSYRADLDAPRSFYSALGFEPWYALHDLTYSGPLFPEPALTVEPYEDRHFEAYLEIINECFYDIRKRHDFRPHRVFAPEAFTDSSVRRELLEGARNTYMFQHDGELVGLGVLEDAVDGDGNGVDIVAVKPAFRRRGFGRQITQFCLNRLLECGVGTAYVAVVDDNVAARRLYESMGCSPSEVYEEARLFLTPQPKPGT